MLAVAQLVYEWEANTRGTSERDPGYRGYDVERSDDRSSTSSLRARSPRTPSTRTRVATMCEECAAVPA